MTEWLQTVDLSWWEVLLGGACTLAIFSFLLRENPVFRFFEHTFIGIATAIGIMAQVRDFILPSLVKPLLGLDRVRFPDGSYGAEYDVRILLYLIPVVFGCFYYFIYSKRYAWLAQLVIGFTLGMSAGLAFKGTFNEMLPQLEDSFRPLYIPGDPWGSLGNIVFVFTLVSSFSYFFFTFRRKPGGPTERVATSGRFMLMGCFGAFFGATIMARMALLVERLEFLINVWGPQLLQSFHEVWRTNV